jgi:hypothetical protein
MADAATDAPATIVRSRASRANYGDQRPDYQAADHEAAMAAKARYKQAVTAKMRHATV